MADWSLIETTLGSWVTSITGLPAYWRGRARAPVFTNDGYALLTISSIKTLGTDQIHTEYDATRPAGTEYQVWQRGHRTFTFGTQIRTMRKSVDYDAKNYSSLLRGSTRLPTKTKAVLDAADISVATILKETNLDHLLDGRDLSVSQLDILMNAISVVEDTPVGYIETLTDATIQDGDGNDLWAGDITIG